MEKNYQTQVESDGLNFINGFLLVIVFIVLFTMAFSTVINDNKNDFQKNKESYVDSILKNAEASFNGKVYTFSFYNTWADNRSTILDAIKKFEIRHQVQMDELSWRGKFQATVTFKPIEWFLKNI